MYHYFGNKDELFGIVIEKAYIEFREAEAALEIEKIEPVAAISALCKGREVNFQHRFTAMADSSASLSGKLIVLLGGGGFLGTHVAQELLAAGARLRIACRHPKQAYRIKALGNLGQVQFLRADITDTAVLPALVAGCDGVVNLVGAFKGDLNAVHVTGPAALAKAAKAAGASAFVHVSANGADAGSEVDYARTKGEGEAAVLAAFMAISAGTAAVIDAVSAIAARSTSSRGTRTCTPISRPSCASRSTSLRPGPRRWRRLPRHRARARR